MATGINFDDAHQYNHPDNPIVATVGCTDAGRLPAKPALLAVATRLECTNDGGPTRDAK